ncbi:hypothetical protein F8Y91_22970 [Vibrio alginolyticus]|uniref:hypothetical protein n=1 Tax=Vibrio alginolyticus TaxID=663 RepID=UPI001D590A53|nr:hypothetical protein [Vibrio alginolyticus]EGQ9235346.1 hypothetical protein [Vibrio alginolyticus]MCR9561244.1 hypothetical protein [Vibrio alginolyticus]
MIGDNPAARLLHILEEGKQYTTNDNCRSVWKAIFELEDEPDHVLMTRIAKAMELPGQIITILNKDFPNQRETYNYWSERVNNAFFQQNLNSSWHSFISHVDSHTLLYLRLNADLIQTKTPTSLLSVQDLTDVRERVSELLTELLELDLEPEVKEFLARNLQAMLHAIDEYRISGAVPVMDIIERTFGHAFFDDKFKATLSESDFGKKVVETLSIVADTMTIALGVPQLPQAFSFYLEALKNT